MLSAATGESSLVIASRSRFSNGAAARDRDVRDVGATRESLALEDSRERTERRHLFSSKRSERSVPLCSDLKADAAKRTGRPDQLTLESVNPSGCSTRSGSFAASSPARSRTGRYIDARLDTYAKRPRSSNFSPRISISQRGNDSSAERTTERRPDGDR